MKLEEELWKTDGLIETEVDSLVIKVHNDKDSSASSFEVDDFSSSSESEDKRFFL